MKEIRTLAEFGEVIEGKTKLVVVHFYADWIGPCKKMMSSLENLAAENEDVEFFQVNVEDGEGVAIGQSQNIESMPTIKFYRNDLEKGKVEGDNFGEVKRKILELV